MHVKSRAIAIAFVVKSSGRKGGRWFYQYYFTRSKFRYYNEWCYSRQCFVLSNRCVRSVLPSLNRCRRQSKNKPSSSSRASVTFFKFYLKTHFLPNYFSSINIIAIGFCLKLNFCLKPQRTFHKKSINEYFHRDLCKILPLKNERLLPRVF